MRPPVISFIVLCGQFATAGGCGPRDFYNENDRLREQVATMQAEHRDLQRRLAELQAELAQAAAAPGSVSEEVRANTPHVAAIEITRLSHARDTDADGRADELLLYVVPRDGLSRFVQAVGELSVHAAVLPAGSPAQTIGQIAIGSTELRGLYRYSFAGLHYALTVPIELAVDEKIEATAVAVEFEDGLSGRTFRAERSIDLTIPRR